MVEIERKDMYGEAVITYVGFLMIEGKPKYVLVNSDEGRNSKVKFPGLRFRATSPEKTLDDVARERFEEQTGLRVSKDLGLRAVMPTRSRHEEAWLFRNIFFGVVDDLNFGGNDGRKVYTADADGVGEIYPIKGGRKRKLNWVVDDNIVIARVANHVINHFDWGRNETNWYNRIPTLTAEPLTNNSDRKLGCALAISSMMLLYRPSPQSPQQIILLKRKGDKYPGYAGGKIETPEGYFKQKLQSESCAQYFIERRHNLDPISCCVAEGREEFGFDIQPRALVCVANTALDCPDNKRNYNGLFNYAFVAEPTNPLCVREALKNPQKHLERKMESYVVESLGEHMERVARGELRMPDMSVIGRKFFEASPGQHIPLTQFISSGLV